MSNFKAAMQRKARNQSQLIIPLLALLLLIIFNLIRDPSFFSVALGKDSYGNAVLSGNLIAVLNGASELAILAMGMTLVTSASRGQDISVGAVAAVAGSIFVKVLLSAQITAGLIVVAILASFVAAMLCGAFSGTLVSVFKIQPMIATLILFTIGRSIAYWINGGASPQVNKAPLSFLGGFIPGIPIPSSIFVVIVCGVVIAIALKFTNLGLYTQAVGINEKAARLNGINPVRIKLLVFMISGVCAAIAACINVSRLGGVTHDTILLGIEMDAILAVAIGGNVLSGGKFNMVGSVIGAYVIQGLTTTLLAMQVKSAALPAYKAVAVVILVVIGSPVVKRIFGRLWGKTFSKKAALAITEAPAAGGDI